MFLLLSLRFAKTNENRFIMITHTNTNTLTNINTHKTYFEQEGLDSLHDRADCCKSFDRNLQNTIRTGSHKERRSKCSSRKNGANIQALGQTCLASRKLPPLKLEPIKWPPFMGAESLPLTESFQTVRLHWGGWGGVKERTRIQVDLMLLAFVGFVLLS